MANRYRNYGPKEISADSSFSWEQKSDDHTGPILVLGEGLCPCGCGESPKGGKAVFAMGHDARYRGKLMRAHVAGIPVSTVAPDGKKPTEHDPRKLAAEHNWEHYLDAAKAREELRLAEKLDRANKKLVDDALQVGDKRLIKIGRWEHTGQVVAIFDHGESIEFQYVTKSGEKKRHRMPKEKAVEAPAA